MRVHRQAGTTGVGVCEKHAVPVLAAIGSAVDAAFLLRAGGAAERAHEGDVGIRRMNENYADAAGGIEAVIALLAIQNGLMPAGLNVEERDPALKLNYLQRNQHASVHRVLSNSFGFGGSNASLVFGGAA
jgi:hypothetical protein